MAHRSPIQLELEPESGATQGAAKRLPRYLLKFRLKGGPADSEAFLVHNLSQTGALIETSKPLSVGEPLTLHFPGVAPVRARVEWANGAFYGCSFAELLGDATLTAILTQAPPDHPRHKNKMSAAKGRHGRGMPGADFPKRLKALRERSGLSIEQLAQRANVSRQAVWYWEGGRSTPSPASLQRLVRALGVPPEELSLEKAPQLSESRIEILEFKTWLADSLGVSPEAIQIRIDL